MKKILLLVFSVALMSFSVSAQTHMAVPHGSFEQWTNHPGYSASISILSLPIYSSFTTPTGWNYLSYPVDTSFSTPLGNASINTAIPLVLASQETTSVPDSSYAAKLQSFMLEDIVSAGVYTLLAANLDSMLTEMVFPSILSTGEVNLEHFIPILNSLLSNMDSVEALLASLATIDVNYLITGGMALNGFEPSRLTGFYKYQSASSGDNGGVLLLGTHYNTTTHQRDVVGGGVNISLTDIANYTPFTVDYVSLHEMEPSFPEQAPDSLIILLLSSASTTMQQGSYMCVDNLALWHDTNTVVEPDTCAGITSLAVTPDIHEAVVNWSTSAVVNGFELEYGAAGFAQGSGTLVSLTNNTYALSSLAANTAYDIYVRTVCANSTYGDWSSLQFTTLPDTCASVLYLSLESRVYDTWPEYELEWNGSSQPDHWEVVYGPQGSDMWQWPVVTTYETRFDVNQLERDGLLTPNTLYYFGVRSVCENEVYGEWEFVEYLTPCAQIEEATLWDDSVSVTSEGRLQGYRVSWIDTINTEWYVTCDFTDNPIPGYFSGYTETVTEPFCYLPELRPGRQYYVEISPRCGEDNYGQSEFIFFTTREVGIQQVEAISLSVYPNPASGSCEVTLSSDEPAELSLYSLDGHLLQTIVYKSSPVELQLPAQGVYLLQATTAAGKTTHKIVCK